MEECGIHLRLKKGDEQLHSDEIDRYRAIFDLSPHPIIIYGESGIVDLNKATLTMFAIPTVDVFFHTHWQDLAPLMQPNGVTLKNLFEDLVQVANIEGTATAECICKKYGSDDAFPVEATVSAFKLHDDVFHQLSLIDLSQEKHRQNALHSKKDAVTLHAPAKETSVITTSLTGEVTYMNQAACQLTGYSLLDAMGKPVTSRLSLVDSLSGKSLKDCFQGDEQAPFRFSMGIVRGAAGADVKVEASLERQCLNDGTALGYVLTLNELSEQKDSELQWHATHDSLTRLPNRVLLAERFKQAVYAADRHQKSLAVCMVDIDEFKPVNDEHGHAVGDLLLIEIASRFKQYLRQDDTVARLGGDEFVLLLGNMDNRTEFYQAIQRIRSAIAEPYFLEGKRFVISCSIGVTMYPDDDADADLLLRHADQAMFVAKQAGRNRVHWFDVEQDQQVSSSQQLIGRIEQGLLADEFELYYQPKVNMRTGDIVGMEALIRWNHPEEGVIPPLDFLPYIEQDELSIRVGDWVLERVLTQLDNWQEQGHDWSVSVNITAKHFHLSSFTSRLKSVLRRFPHIKPEKLEIEILESVVLGDLQHVQKVIEECKALGVRFALDDFGTGYSSLSYLKRLAVNVIKIDQSFVRNILNDKGDLALVQAISSLAVTFGHEVIGEGVETIEQGVLLMRLGCDVAQGFGVSGPMPSGEVAHWAKQFVLDPKWRAWSNSDWDLNAFPLLVAQYDIKEWVNKVAKQIEKGVLPLERAQFTHESQCRFGAWYQSDGFQRFGDLQVFRDIDPIHREFHRVGNEIVHLYVDGQTGLAQKKCPDLYALVDEMFSMLDELQQKAFIQ